MDPNANLQEQERILERSTRRDADGTSQGLVPTRDDHDRLLDLQAGLRSWLHQGGFEPDWTQAPLAREYYRQLTELAGETDRIFAAFAWCPVCKTQHHPENTTCDGLRGGTTDTLAQAPAAAETEPEHYGPRAVACFQALQVLVLTRSTREYLRTHDPRALQQAARALHDVGLRYLVREDTDQTDLCWYCFAPLVTTFPDGQAYCSDCGTVAAPPAGGRWE